MERLLDWRPNTSCGWKHEVQGREHQICFVACWDVRDLSRISEQDTYQTTLPQNLPVAVRQIGLAAVRWHSRTRILKTASWKLQPDSHSNRRSPIVYTFAKLHCTRYVVGRSRRCRCTGSSKRDHRENPRTPSSPDRQTSTT